MTTTRSLPFALLAAIFFSAFHAYSAPGDLYVAEPTRGGHIYKYTPTGDKSTVASGIYQPVALAFDRAGNLYVANPGTCVCIPEIVCECPPSTIIKITPNGIQSTFATLSSDQLGDLAFDGVGNLFVSTANSILKITPDGTQSTFASPMPGAWRLAFDSSGYLYATVAAIGPNSVLKFAPDGSSSTFVTFPAGTSITALAFNSVGELFLERGGSILKVSRDGSSTVFASIDFYTGSLAFDAAGNLFVGENAYNTNDPAILKFAPDASSSTFATGVLLPHGFAFEPTTEKLRNLSARGFVGTGDNVLIAGLIVGGNALANNAVVVRALGPSLAGPGVDNPLPNPSLEVRDSSGALVAANDDWQSTQKQQIEASGLAPADTRESAIFAMLPAGSYTAVVRSQNGNSGTALVEVYSLN